MGKPHEGPGARRAAKGGAERRRHARENERPASGGAWVERYGTLRNATNLGDEAGAVGPLTRAGRRWTPLPHELAYTVNRAELRIGPIAKPEHPIRIAQSEFSDACV